MYGLFTYMKGEKWPHEQVEMAQGKSSHPIRRIWDWFWWLGGLASMGTVGSMFNPILNPIQTCQSLEAEAMMLFPARNLLFAVEIPHLF